MNTYIVPHISREERRTLCEAKATINGRPASIGGATRDFAIITDTASGLHAEWAWPTVKHIVETKNGAFKL